MIIMTVNNVLRTIFLDLLDNFELFICSVHAHSGLQYIWFGEIYLFILVEWLVT